MNLLAALRRLFAPKRPQLPAGTEQLTLHLSPNVRARMKSLWPFMRLTSYTEHIRHALALYDLIVTEARQKSAILLIRKANGEEIEIELEPEPEFDTEIRPNKRPRLVLVVDNERDKDA